MAGHSFRPYRLRTGLRPPSHSKRAHFAVDEEEKSHELLMEARFILN